METDPDRDGYPPEELEQGLSIQRKQVRLCRHKLQTRAYPKGTKVKKAWRFSEHNLEPENQDLDHEWLQLVQLEKVIEEHKNRLLEADARDRGDLDTEDVPFNENGESIAKRSEHLDDGDLEYINNILNSFSNIRCYREGSSQRELKSLTTEDAPARACASPKMPPKFNLNFNQNSTTRSQGEEHFSYFSSIGDERDIELGDYFSDDKEDDTGGCQNLESESNFWSPTEFKNLEDKFPLSQ